MLRADGSSGYQMTSSVPRTLAFLAKHVPAADGSDDFLLGEGRSQVRTAPKLVFVPSTRRDGPSANARAKRPCRVYDEWFDEPAR